MLKAEAFKKSEISLGQVEGKILSINRATSPLPYTRAAVFNEVGFSKLP